MMGKSLVDEQHEGVCEHCRSEVPLDASVCVSCGAVWGTSTGMTRQQIYSEGKTKIIVGLVVSLLLLCFFIVTAYFRSPWVLVAMALGFFAGIPAFGYIIGGIFMLRNAKRAEINWWREN